jgi:hypothetical protein
MFISGFLMLESDSPERWVDFVFNRNNLIRYHENTKQAYGYTTCSLYFTDGTTVLIATTKDILSGNLKKQGLLTERNIFLGYMQAPDPEIVANKQRKEAMYFNTELLKEFEI